MNLTVWKYDLDIQSLDENNEVCVAMPAGAEVLTAREQGPNVCVWARVNPDEKRIVKRRFAVCGTGHPASAFSYLGTAMLMNGTLVLHVFVVSDGMRSVPR